jgi:phosphopantetheinyl transferase
VIYWDLRAASEHDGLRSGSPPAGLLSGAERAAFASLRTPKRRRDWLLGRWTGKALCRGWLAREGVTVAAERLSILAAPDGAPEALIETVGPLSVVLSLSHRDDFGLAALCDDASVLLGADIELCEPRPPGFAEDFFNGGENAWLVGLQGEERVAGETELWSLKEAALKAARVGLRADTRSVEVTAPRMAAGAWTVTGIELRLGRPIAAVGWVQRRGPHVISIVRVGGEPGEIPSDELRGHPALPTTAGVVEIVHEL